MVRTICTATADRQGAARELAGKVDVFFVFGGKNSANTRHLYDIAASLNPVLITYRTPVRLPHPCWPEQEK